VILCNGEVQDQHRVVGVARKKKGDSRTRESKNDFPISRVFVHVQESTRRWLHLYDVNLDRIDSSCRSKPFRQLFLKDLKECRFVDRETSGWR